MPFDSVSGRDNGSSCVLLSFHRITFHKASITSLEELGVDLCCSSSLSPWGGSPNEPPATAPEDSASPKKRSIKLLIKINAVRIPNSCRNEADHREFCERTALDATLDFRQLRETEWPGRQSESRRSELIEVNCLGSFTEFGTLTRMSP